MIRRKFFAACAAAAAGVCGPREASIKPDTYVPGPLRLMPKRFRISRVDIINPDLTKLDLGPKPTTSFYREYVVNG